MTTKEEVVVLRKAGGYHGNPDNVHCLAEDLPMLTLAKSME